MAEQPQDHARISGTGKVTIPATPFREACFEPGDILRVEAERAGRIVLTRVDELLDRYSGCLDTGGTLRGRVVRLRKEWP